MHTGAATSIAKMRSRRKEFRYGNFHLNVRFKTAYDEGTATLVNISTGGCALKNLSPLMIANDNFLLIIDPDDIDRPIQAKAVVLRVEGNTVAAQFTLISTDAQNALRNYFIKKQRNS